LIHLMGFVKPFGLAEIPQLKETTSKATGVLWLLAALILVAASVLKGFDHEAWWVPAAIGVVLSQALIILQSPPIVISFASARFHVEVNKDLKSQPLQLSALRLDQVVH
jgi:hypothetical protein